MESDGEIEYLDEDADVVQQCVIAPPIQLENLELINQNLLVERSSTSSKGKKRKKVEEDDSDYDPRDDRPRSPDSRRKKKKANTRKSTTSVTPAKSVETLRKYSRVNYSPQVELYNRKKMNIKIPDYPDPLCLPVRASNGTKNDQHRLKHWNNACLEHFKHSDLLLKPEIGETKSSIRTIVLRNMVHKETGKSEMAMWSKTSVESTEGKKKSEIFQSILPKYREKKVLNRFKFQAWKKKKFHHVDEVVLGKEDQKDGEVLVAYRPKESISAVYKYYKVEREDNKTSPNEETSRALKEVACCKVCAPCFQTSWRGFAKKNDKVQCPACGRALSGANELLTHARSHHALVLKKHRTALAELLTGLLEYHYKCRICQKKLSTIKDIRSHVATHKGNIPFKCEIGNHMAS